MCLVQCIVLKPGVDTHSAKNNVAQAVPFESTQSHVMQSNTSALPRILVLEDQFSIS